MANVLRVEYAHQRKIRERNKPLYRVAHWPIWIWVFFLAPGPWTFQLFAHGFSVRHAMWLAAVLVGTGLAALAAQLPGVEQKPYILRFNEDRPNPLYRRVCYTFAWNALLNYALMNFAGLVWAVVSGRWMLQQIYRYAYLPCLLVIVVLGALGALPRVGPSTKGEGIERRYFYGAIWACSTAQFVLLLLWKLLPRTHQADIFKLFCYVAVLLAVGVSSIYGLLPRTRPILPGELMVAD
jgi:hypothetical protein